MSTMKLTHECLVSELDKLPEITEHGEYLRRVTSLYEVHCPSQNSGKITASQLATLIRVHEYERRAGLPETPMTFMGDRRIAAMASKAEHKGKAS